MIGLAMYTTILTLYKQEKSQREISRITKTHRNSVKKIITRFQKEKTEEPISYKRKSKLEVWHKQIVELIGTKLTNIRIHEELKLLGFDGSYAALTSYIRTHRIKDNTCIRFHVDAGEEAQVDFGDIRLQPDSEGKIRKAYVFNMKLSYSRLDYYEVVFDQKVETWIKCHINAFGYFGGIPKCVKIDNLKAGVINSNYYEPVYQKEYKRFADHYSFLISNCRPYQPQEKGKVESGIKYVKNNLFAGRKFSSNDALNKQLKQWQESANSRIHGTTKCQPIELFVNKEKPSLTNLPIVEFNMSSWHMRKVAKDCHITLENNYYSVPCKYVAKEILVSLSSELVKIYFENELIATHARNKGQGAFSTVIAHYPEYKRLCPGFKEYDDKYKGKMKEIGESSALMLLHLEKQQHKNAWHRMVRGIVSLRKTYSDEMIDKSCKRAIYYGVYSYGKVKSILENHCYDLPLPETEVSHAKIA